ncbi:MAG: GNAT family N-acetyltransferase [Bacteroides sp.]|nr:GNAT family N-acetyltransferase [Bacteroides sp.]MDD2645264.1 GNAT family N-acetyltransferase [Bacteroides sp.]MDD4054969.1 GNAT family N-acetyltransferase [Bacteroides sp.]MDD4719595.1 GNAT family N-acetyltransferase [Bacteroides sp.]
MKEKGHTHQFDNGYSIREAQLADADAIFNALDQNREYFSKWLYFVPYMQSVEDEKEFLKDTLSVPYASRDIVFVIEYEGVFSGLIGFVNTNRQSNKTEIGYWLLPEHQGKGTITKAVKHLTHWAFTEWGMNRVKIQCAVGNEESNKVPQRLGFTKEGIEREGQYLPSGEYVDLCFYSLLKREMIK